MPNFFDKYPYTDFHELNLDWIIKTVKETVAEWAVTLTEWHNTQEEWQQLYDYVHDYFDNLDVQEEINNKLDAMALDGSLAALAQPIIDAKVAELLPDEVSAQIGSTVADQIGSTVAGQLPGVVNDSLPAVASPIVTDWLNDHITQPTTPIVDTSLTISGAAADALVTGDLIRLGQTNDDTLRYQLDDSMVLGNLLSGIDFVDQILIDSSTGAETTNASYCSSPYIPVDGGGSYRIYSVSGGTKTLLTSTRAATYDKNFTFIACANNVNSINSIAANAAYLRITLPTAQLNNVKVLYKYANSTYPDYPVMYKYGVDARRVNNLKWAIPLEPNGVVFSDDGTDLTVSVNSRLLTSDNRYTSSLTLSSTFPLTAGLFGIALDINTLTLVNRVPQVPYPVNSDYYFLGIWWQKKLIFDPRILQPKNHNTSVSLSSNEYSISTKSCSYTFKKVTDPAKNLDTWRWTLMTFPAGSTVFNDVDAEGVIRVSGESDFIGGYHGSEVATNFRVFIDGVDITSLTSFSNKSFDKLSFFVESDVYHCYLDPDAASVAFTRQKIITFENDKITISNCWKASNNIVISGARTMLLSVNKWIGFNNYYVNSDYKLYDPNNYNVDHPADSKQLTGSQSIFASGKMITFTNKSVNNDHYMGSVVDLTTRLKYYYDSYQYGVNTTLMANETINTTSEITIE